MVSPRPRRDAVAWAQSAYGVSERRACRALAVERSLVRYASRRPADTALRARLRELATTRISFGSRRLHTLLRREINLFAIQTLSTEAPGLEHLKIHHARRSCV